VDPPQVIDARDHESRLVEKNSGAQAFLFRAAEVPLETGYSATPQ
jgi:hypothetical protein